MILIILKFRLNLILDYQGRLDHLLLLSSLDESCINYGVRAWARYYCVLTCDSGVVLADVSIERA